MEYSLKKIEQHQKRIKELEKEIESYEAKGAKAPFNIIESLKIVKNYKAYHEDEIKRIKSILASNEANKRHFKCALCKKQVYSYPHNGEPLVNGKVCSNNCNYEVIKERFKENK